jgi:hypothetical protein
MKLKLSQSEIYNIIENHVRKALTEDKIDRKSASFLRNDHVNMAGVARELMDKGVIQSDNEDTARSVISKWSRGKRSIPKKAKSIIKKIATENADTFFKTYIIERDVLQVPDSGGAEEEAVDPNADVQEEVPMDDPNANMDMQGGEDENMDPDAQKIIELLGTHPEKGETVLKYLEGIIGDEDDVQEEVPMDDPNANMDMQGDEMQAPDQGEQPPMPESRQITLDELVGDILGRDKKQSKPTISRPIGKNNDALRTRLFKPLRVR